MPNPNFREFLGYVKEKSKFGQNGYDSPTEYVPGQALEEFWTTEKVKEVLNALNIPTVHPELISPSFVRIFSILVYIGNVEEIEQFTRYQLDDKHLPFPAQPTQWSDSPRIKEFFDEFFLNQWRFCPLEFRDGYVHMRELSPQMILPVTVGKRLNQPSAGRDVSIISKVEIHDECNDKNIIKTDTVVFKVYQTDTAVDLFTTEVGAYTSFPSHTEYITRYYGSFVQNKKRTIILEHAPGGTLLHFFQKTRRPNNDQELTALWSALFQLLQGLHLIHEMSPPNDVDADKWVFSTTHNDIQPANILVFPQSSGQTYDIKFKLADFGTSHLRQRLAGAKYIPAATSDANRMYLAPESCSLHEVHEYVRNRVDQTIDVWALGAIYSEVLIWTIWGEEGREQYRERRKNETARIPVLQGSGYNSCFHNGVERLDVVETIHYEALDHTRRSDTSSAFISELILDHMLQPKDKGRLNPITTLTKAQNLWQKANRQSSWNMRLARTPSRPSVVQATLFDELPLNTRRIRSQSDASFYTPSPSQSAGSPIPIRGPGMVPYEMEDQSFYQHNLPTPPSSLEKAYQHSNAEIGGLNTGGWPPPRVDTSVITPISPLADSRHSPFGPITDGVNPFARQSEPSVVEAPGQDIVRRSTVHQAQGNGTSPTSWSSQHPRGELASTIHAPLNSQGSASTRAQNEEIVTFEQIYPLLGKKAGNLFRRLSNTPKKSSSDIMTQPGIKAALSQVKTNGLREQILLIDDFSSMGPHKRSVEKAARVTSYYVKDIDPNDIELYFASDMTNPGQYSTSSALEAAIHGHDFVSGFCNMESILGNILENKISTGFRAKPVSVYVFTDGVWEPGDDCHVDSVIARAAQHLMAKKALPQQIMIQFIRFGDDPVGISRLDHLDDGIVKKFGLDKKFDIVDTRSYNEHVPDILVGSISRFNDQKKAYTHAEATSVIS